MAENTTVQPEALVIAEAPQSVPLVRIKYKEVAPVDIIIDREQLTWDEFVELQSLKDLSEGEILTRFKALLGKLTGRDIGTMPAYQVTEIIKNVSQLVSGSEIKN